VERRARRPPRVGATCVRHGRVRCFNARILTMPATSWSGYHRFCPLARALDAIGERWTLVIVHELLSGARRYGELQRRLPGIGTNLLADRLRKLESAGVVERQPGPTGSIVVYQLTAAGRDLEPALRTLREWGVRYLYGAGELADTTGQFDVSFGDGVEDLPDEVYEWRVGEQTTTLKCRGGQLCQQAGRAEHPAVVSTTSAEFMRRWAAGSTSWDEGRAVGDVKVRGSNAAWKRMQAATGYLRSYAATDRRRRTAS